MVDPVLVAKAAALLTDEKTRKVLGWVVAAVLSPLILVVAVLCVLASGAADHNVSAVQMCFEDGPLPDDLPEEYRVCVEQMRTHFAELDAAVTGLQSNMEDGNGLDPIRVKAMFFSLYFGSAAPDITAFVDCFVTCEEHAQESGELCTVAVPVADMAAVCANITASLGTPIPDGLSANVDSVYSLVKNGYPGLPEGGGFKGAGLL